MTEQPDNMADGKGCKCCAYSQSECTCGADWTTKEVYDLRRENKKLKDLITHVLATTSYECMSEKTRVKLLRAANK